jgi:transcriptional regulator with XRE-family HTH domain
LTQSALAKLAGMSKAGVTHLEQGLREPKWSTVQELARVLNVGIEEFAKPANDAAPRPRGRPTKVAPKLAKKSRKGG